MKRLLLLALLVMALLIAAQCGGYGIFSVLPCFLRLLSDLILLRLQLCYRSYFGEL